MSSQFNWIDQDLPSAAHLSSGFPESMVLLDCETTGGNANYHRIIEVGLIVIEHGEVIEEWQSFINPNTILPESIQRLTGITPGMLRDAPKFSAVSESLLSKIEGRTLVAHNARFDYSFLKNEFERAGINFRAKPLCSVKFSRNLYPQFKRHGLSEIIKRFGFSIQNRHRALDDAKTIYDFFLRSSQIFSNDEILATCKTALKLPALPALLDIKEIEKLPARAGVYYFYDQNSVLLYIGKSVHLRNRVMSHFSSDHKNSKDLQMSSKITRIEFELTPSDFGAQIRESNQIKLLNPLYNRRLRKVKKLFQYRSGLDDRGYLRLQIETVEMEATHDESHFGLFRSRRQAAKQMLRLADQYFLCHQMLGIEAFDNKLCFRSQLKKCFGGCCGIEPAETYNERVTGAIKNYQRKQWLFSHAVVIEEASCEGPGESVWHMVDHWRYIGQVRSLEDIHDLGYTVLRPEKSNRGAFLNDHIITQVGNEDFLEQEVRFDFDIYCILVRFLLSKEKMALNRLKIWPIEKLCSQIEF